MIKTKNSVFCLLRKFSAFEIQSRCEFSDKRQSNMLAKLMTGKKKPNFKWTDSIGTQKPSSVFEVKKKPTKMTARRAIVLNKMFMRHVTDIISSGPIGYELSGLGLEITQVKVCQHYHGLNIFWTASGTDDFDAVEQKLESIKKPLRHELHQMQLMGNCPHLTFVRDAQLSYFDLLDNAISKADYGDDYEPSSSSMSKIQSDFDVQCDVNEPVSGENEPLLIPMRQDVFGLDHALIMRRIKQSMAKTKQAWKAYDDRMSNPSSSKPFTFTTSFESIRQEQVKSEQSKEILTEFLTRRKQLRKQQRMEQAEFDAAIMEEWQRENIDEDEYDSTNEDFFEDPNEVQQFYDNYDPVEK